MRKPGIMFQDLARMAQSGPAQLGGRVSHDPDMLAEAAFQDTHGGMSRATAAERARVFEREAWEADNLGDLEADDFGGSTPRERFAAYHALRKSEEDKLAALQAKRSELESIAGAPLTTESDIRAALRRSADFLLGKSKEDSDTAKRVELESRRAEQLHRAEAARLAMGDIAREITVAELRVKRLRERHDGFLAPVLAELFSPIHDWIETKRREINVFEQSLPDARYAVMAALEKDPGADVAKMLPALKF
jgi:hypothetical protein